jgi:phosphoglycerol transferase MdoB-like AlkP superfamily enzyme
MGILRWIRSRFQPLTDILLFVAANAALFFAARLALLYFLLPEITERGAIAKALYIGLKFDVRIAVFMALPLALCLLVPRWERSVGGSAPSAARRVLCTVTGLMAALAMLLYILDFGFFFYLHQHIDMSSTVFLEDPSESARMVWQSYPVPAIALGYAAALVLYAWLFIRFVRGHVPSATSGRIGKWRRAGLTLAALLALFVMGYGQVSSNLFPLRWSNAYFCADNNISLLAVNPIQNIWDTRNFGKAIPPDPRATREAWPRMARWLRLPEGAAPLSYMRHVAGRPMEKRPNIVIIIMESLCWERTSLAPSMPAGMGAGIDPTPFLKELAGKSLYFPNFYAPTRTTARAVFTTISGVPDVNHTGGTTSRNPRLVDQASVLAEFDGYEKYYMIGGNANWANIRGLLQHNVPGLHLLEESSWKAPNIDVWGISDIALFREAVDVLGEGRKPFAAVIQTASFHRPYTIPDDNEGYAVPPDPSPEALAWYGYESAKEFRSLNLSDHALRRFFDKASRQPWFKDTVFAIFGDHGLNHDSGNITPAVQACNLQAWHVPLLIYAPGGHVAPGVDETLRMQPDVLPGMAALAGMDFFVSSMGRDILDGGTKGDAAVFISHANDTRFLLKDGYVYAIRASGGALYRLDEQTVDGKARDLALEQPERAAAMRRELMDFYYTAQYMLHHNGKENIQRARKAQGGRP